MMGASMSLPQIVTAAILMGALALLLVTGNLLERKWPERNMRPLIRNLYGLLTGIAMIWIVWAAIDCSRP